MFKPMKMVKGYLSWMIMHYSGILGVFRLLGDSLGGIARRRGGFNVVSSSEVSLEGQFDFGTSE